MHRLSQSLPKHQRAIMTPERKSAILPEVAYLEDQKPVRNVENENSSSAITLRGRRERGMNKYRKRLALLLFAALPCAAQSLRLYDDFGEKFIDSSKWAYTSCFSG